MKVRSPEDEKCAKKINNNNKKIERELLMHHVIWGAMHAHKTFRDLGDRQREYDAKNRHKCICATDRNYIILDGHTVA